LACRGKTAFAAKNANSAKKLFYFSKSLRLLRSLRQEIFSNLHTKGEASSPFCTDKAFLSSSD
jgi:hypothetical protein